MNEPKASVSYAVCPSETGGDLITITIRLPPLLAGLALSTIAESFAHHVTGTLQLLSTFPVSLKLTESDASETGSSPSKRKSHPGRSADGMARAKAALTRWSVD